MAKKKSERVLTKEERYEADLNKQLEESHTMSQDEKRVLAIIKKRLSAIKTDKNRVAYMARLPDWDKYYENEKVKQYYKGEADLFIPMIFETVEVITTYLLAILCFADPCFKIKGFEKNDIELAEDLWYPYLTYQMTKKFNFEERMEDAVMCVVKYGTLAVKNGWRVGQKFVKKDTGKRTKAGNRILNRVKKILWDYPDCQVWPLPDVFFDTQDPEFEEFTFVAFRKWERLDEVIANDKTERDDGIYYHTKWLKRDDYAKNWGSEYSLTADQKRYKHLKYTETFECWLNYDLDHDGYKEDIVAVMANDKLIIRLQQNPHDGDWKPLLLTQFVKREEKGRRLPYGIGVPEILEKMQIELNDTANQTMDNASFILNNMWIFDFTALDEAAASVYLKSKQGGLIPVDPAGMPLDNVVKPLEKPDIIQAGILKMKMIREWGRDATGTPSSIQGVPSKYKPTATEFAGTQSSAMRRLTKVAKRMERKIIKPWLERAIALNYQHVDRKELLRVVGEKAAKHKDKSPTELMMNCDFVPVGSMELEDKTAKVQQLLYYLKVALSVPPQMSRVNIPNLMKMIWREMGQEFKNVEDDIFLEDPQKELINPEDENVLMESGAELLPHPFDDHEQHDMVHSRIEQKENVEKHRQKHQELYQQIVQGWKGQGGVGPQELPQPGAERVVSKAPGEVLGEQKAPTVL